MPPTSTPAPAGASARHRRGRLQGVDATRGVALVGMMAVHVLPPTDADGSASLAYLVASGRAAAAFAVLAGVGLALATGGPQPPRGRAWGGAALATVVRGLLIGLVGLLVAEADTDIAIVLTYYGALFLLAPPLLGLRPAALAGVAVGVAVVGPAVSLVVRTFLPRATYDVPTLDRLLDTPGAVAAELLLTGYYPATAWLAYLAAGLAVGRLALGSLRVQVALLAGGALLALAATAVSAVLLGPLGGQAELLATQPQMGPAELDAALDSSLYGTAPTSSWWWLAVDAPHSSTPPDLLATGGTSLALLGALLLLARTAGALLRPLAAAGSMTLTLYTAHVLLLASGWLPEDPETSWLLQVALALAVAPAWRLVARRGPLEALVAAAAGRARALVVPGAPAAQAPAPAPTGLG
ncbi:MAG: heparan-alpha-glucosaminide N-acetyltransferase domain-containing protein [Actinomycetota bacterium]|nr:heparan-alpha-glucosaminide N-acetyltransferase domain-containing protein [Actinomycetota bacterium]